MDAIKSKLLKAFYKLLLGGRRLKCIETIQRLWHLTTSVQRDWENMEKEEKLSGFGIGM